MPLLTINDLETLPLEEKNRLIKMATGLSTTYLSYVANNTGSSEYKVEIGGERTRSAGIHASEISNCLRQVVYSLTDTERKSDPTKTDVNMRMRFGMGHAIHAMLQNDWHQIADKSEGKIEFVDEVRISPKLGGCAEDWDIRSSCDGIITLHQDGKPLIRIGLEIKSASLQEFEKLREPKNMHLEQTCVYMATLDLPLMWLLYYNKSNSNISPSFPPYLFQFNKKMWEQSLEGRFGYAHHLAEAGELPDREEGFHCRWCPFSWTCAPPSLSRR